MKIKLEVELEPFVVPQAVYLVSHPGLKQDGMKPKRSIPLGELDWIVLEQLCDDFRTRVLAAHERYTASKIQEDDPTGY